MALSNRELSEAAMRIRERLRMLNASRYNELPSRLETLVVGIERLQNFGQRLRLCTARKWLAAAAEVSKNLAYSLPGLVRDIGHIEDAANRLDALIPSLSELVAELRQAEKEFGQLSYDRKEQFLAVATEPIELEGVSLGDFEIRLLLSDRCSRPSPDELYRVVALDPHPAGSDETVTHPHVRDEQLCAGDAAAAIRSALTSGRICDFFLLVKSVLSQYNRSSPFIPLDKWDGISCHDCGYTIAGGESSYCPSCENDFCEECMSYCHCCEDSLCQGCLTECTACHDYVCPACLTRCPNCRRAICKTCLEENQCSCQKEKENPNGPVTTAAAAANAAAAS